MKHLLQHNSLHALIVLSQEFTCYASTDCHGVIVESPPQRGECCAGRGLSFTLEGENETASVSHGDGFLLFSRNIFHPPKYCNRVYTALLTFANVIL